MNKATRKPTEEKAGKTNHSVEKIMRVMEKLAHHGEPMRLKDLSAELNMPAATTLRFVHTLTRLGYVYQNEETQKYGLTLKLMGLAYKIRSAHMQNDFVAPKLRWLSQQVGESVCYAIREEDEVLYLSVINGPHQVLVARQRIGHRAPLYCTGVGKLFLANGTDEELEGYLRRVKLVPFTHNTHATPDSVRQNIQLIRDQNYALDDEECELGARCIAAPIYDGEGRVVAAVSITGPSLRINPTFISTQMPKLIGVSSSLSEQMGYQFPDNIKRRSDHE